MKKNKSLPTQIILPDRELRRGQLQMAASADTIETARDKLAEDGELIDIMNNLAAEAAAEVGESNG
jgi:hypothetical protein